MTLVPTDDQKQPDCGCKAQLCRAALSDLREHDKRAELRKNHVRKFLRHASICVPALPVLGWFMSILKVRL